MTNQQTIQTRQLIGRQMSYENKFAITAFRQIKRLTKSLTKMANGRSRKADDRMYKSSAST